MSNKSLHIEWIAFFIGILMLAIMNPTTDSASLCLFERMGFTFCLGDGLGHSIAYLFRGDLKASINANFMGPIAVIVLVARILFIWKTIYINYKTEELGTKYV
ncbi:MAG: DUF2752 domain-containing protein [Balneolaceae bacterium]|nr:DUF2752 domain-containing protein [Balneolaceae bacterium]